MALETEEKYGDAPVIARMISKMVSSRRLVRDGDVLRPCEWGDFCILLRGRKGFSAYAAELEKQMKEGNYSRQEFLHEAAKIEGIYVPSLYEVSYKEDGTIAAFTPKYDDIPTTIKKQVDMDLTGSVYPEKPIVPFIKATQDRVVLEIQRGCIRGCRFCQAGMIYRPNREKNVER